MKKRILFFPVLLMVFLYGNLFPQWVQQAGPQGVYSRAILLNGTNIYLSTGSGVYLSTNNGNNWAKISTGLPTNSGNSALAIVGSNIFVANEGNGVYLSSNNGALWSQVNIGIVNLNMKSLYVSGTTIYAGTANGGIYYSTNNGSNWNAINTGIPAAAVVYGISSIGSNLFAGTSMGMFVSTNNGSSWSDISTGLDNNNIRALWVDGTKLYVASLSALYYSTNNGSNWTRVASATVDAIRASGNNIFYADRSLGLRQSTDGGANFVQVAGLDAAQVLTLAMGGQNIYCGSTSSFCVSTDNGTTWNVKNTGLINSYVKYLFSFNSKIIAGNYYYTGVHSGNSDGTNWNRLLGLNDIYTITSNGIDLFIGTMGIYKSTDGGNTASSIASFGTALPVYSIIVSGSNIYAATNNGIRFSADDGNTWGSLNSGLTNLVVYNLLLDNSKLYAGTAGAGIFQSTDWGTTWVPTTLTGKNVVALKTINGVIYAGCWGDGIYASADNGATWTEKNTGITNKSIYGITSDANNNLYVAGGVKLFFSNNNGTSWVDKTGNLPDINIWSLSIINNNVFIGTGGLGVWKRPVSEIVGVSEENKIPSSFSLEQNYPNPFNPETTIKYSIPISETGYVTLKIFDMLGREVAALVNEVKPAGTYSVKFNAVNFASGIYVYQLSTKSSLLSKKMILMK